jgi:tetratricopeptide (TPR) repeat protein
MELDFQPEMVGREKELKELEVYLDRAAEGQGSTLFVTGEAGIGKTRLVDELKREAQSRGFSVLSGGGMFESLTPYMPLMEALKSGGLETLFAEESPRTEAAYLVTDTGLLVKEVVRDQTELDPDLFASMLTTVSDFVKDSLSMLSGEKIDEQGELNSLGYKDYRILIRRGNGANLVVVLKGKENEFLVDDMNRVLSETGKMFGSALEQWDGHEKNVAGIDKLLWPLITSGKYDGKYPGRDDPQVRRNLLFENVSMGVIRQAQASPTLLCIEDLQWADPSTLALLHYVSRNSKSSGLLILGTYRPEDVAEVEGTVHPLTERMRLMNREDLYEKIELRRLSEDGMMEMLASLLDDVDLGHEFRERLHRDTEGNPLFVVELVKMLVEENIIERDSGSWRLTASIDEVNIPSKIYDVILRRLSRVHSAGREILDFASVVGEEFTSDLLSSALDTSRMELLKELRTMEQKHKLINSHNGNYKFDHAKIKEVLYNEIPQELKREYHSLIASTIKTLNKDSVDEVIEDLSFHYYHCRNKEKALYYLYRAAEKAKNNYSNEEAMKFYSHALDLEEDVQKRGETFEALAQINFLMGNYGRSIEFHENALELTKAKNKSAEIKAKIGEILEIKGEYEESIKICTEALGLVEGKESEEEALCLNNIGSVHNAKGDYSQALQYFERSLEIMERIGDLKGIASSLNNIGNLYGNTGEYDKALEYDEKSLEIRERIGDQTGIAGSLNNIGFVHYERGEFDKALEYFNKAVEISERIGHQQFLLRHLGNIGIVHSGRGDYDRALENLEKTLEISAKIGDQVSVARSLANIGFVYWERGEFDRALECFLRTRGINEKIGDQEGISLSFCNVGVMHMERGEYDKALECLRRSVEINEKIGCQAGNVLSLRNIGCVYREIGEYDKALEYSGRSLELGEMIGDQVGIARSLNDIGDVHYERGEYDKALEYLGKCLEIGEKIGERRETSICCGHIAQVHLRTGDLQKALEFCSRAFGLSREIGSRREIASSRRIFGMIYESQGNWVESTENFQKCIEMYEDIGMEVALADSNYEFGLMWKAKGDSDKAKEHLNKAMEIFERLKLERRIEKVRGALDAISS